MTRSAASAERKFVDGLVPTITCIGFLYAEDKGNPALANDLREELRTVIDSLTLCMFNKGILKNRDFYYRNDRRGCFLQDEARKTFLSVFEQRIWEDATDPVSGKTMNIRRRMEMQAQKLKAVLEGSRLAYEPYSTEW